MTYEIWKVLDNFTNYEISSFGQLRNKKTGRIITINTYTKTGYLIVALYNNNNEYKPSKIDRLVANTFLLTQKIRI